MTLDAAVGGYCRHFRGDGFALGGGQLGDGDVGAFGGEGVDDSPANVGAAAGYDDIFTLQSQFHSYSSPKPGRDGPAILGMPPKRNRSNPLKCSTAEPAIWTVVVGSSSHLTGMEVMW